MMIKNISFVIALLSIFVLLQHVSAQVSSETRLFIADKVQELVERVTEPVRQELANQRNIIEQSEMRLKELRANKQKLKGMKGKKGEISTIDKKIKELEKRITVAQEEIRYLSRELNGRLVSQVAQSFRKGFMTAKKEYRSAEVREEEGEK